MRVIGYDIWEFIAIPGMEMGIWGPNELHNCIPLNTNKILLMCSISLC